MRYQIARVKNIVAVSAAIESLRTRDVGVPGIALMWGSTGYGKTTAAAWLANQVNAVFVRAKAIDSPLSLLGSIMKALGAAPMLRCAPMLDFIAAALERSARPLFIDEGDYLVDDKRLVETLRDIHDVSSVPLLAIGMQEFRNRVMHREQLAGRVSQWIEFQPADLEDARIVGLNTDVPAPFLPEHDRWLATLEGACAAA